MLAVAAVGVALHGEAWEANADATSEASFGLDTVETRGSSICLLWLTYTFDRRVKMEKKKQ